MCLLIRIIRTILTLTCFQSILSSSLLENIHVLQEEENVVAITGQVLDGTQYLDKSYNLGISLRILLSETVFEEYISVRSISEEVLETECINLFLLFEYYVLVEQSGIPLKFSFLNSICHILYNGETFVLLLNIEANQVSGVLNLDLAPVVAFNYEVIVTLINQIVSESNLSSFPLEDEAIYLEPYASFAEEARLELSKITLLLMDEVKNFVLLLTFTAEPTSFPPEFLCSQYFQAFYSYSNLLFFDEESVGSCVLESAENLYTYVPRTDFLNSSSALENSLILTFSIASGLFLSYDSFDGTETYKDRRNLAFAMSEKNLIFSRITDPAQLLDAGFSPTALNVNFRLNNPAFIDAFIKNATTAAFISSNLLYIRLASGEVLDQLHLPCEEAILFSNLEGAELMPTGDCIFSPGSQGSIWELVFPDPVFGYGPTETSFLHFELSDSLLDVIFRVADTESFYRTHVVTSDLVPRVELTQVLLKNDRSLQLVFSREVVLGAFQSSFFCSQLFAVFHAETKETIDLSSSTCRLAYFSNVSTPNSYIFSQVDLIFISGAVLYQGGEQFIWIGSPNLVSLDFTAELVPHVALLLSSSVLLPASNPFLFQIIHPREVSTCEANFEISIQQVAGTQINVYTNLTLTFINTNTGTAFVALKRTASTDLNFVFDLLEFLSRQLLFLSLEGESVFIIECTVYETVYNAVLFSTAEGESVVSLTSEDSRIPVGFEGISVGSTFALQINSKQVFKAKIKPVRQAQESGFCDFTILEDTRSEFVFLFTWSIYVDDIIFFEKSSNLSRSLAIQPNSLYLGTYTAELTVSPLNRESTFTERTIAFILEIESSPLVVMLGTPLSAIAGRFTATRSCNPDVLPPSLCDPLLGFRDQRSLENLTEESEQLFFLGFGEPERFNFTWACLTEDCVILDQNSLSAFFQTQSDDAQLVLFSLSDFVDPTRDKEIFVRVFPVPRSANTIGEICPFPEVEIEPLLSSEASLNPDIPLSIVANVSGFLEEEYSPNPNLTEYIFSWDQTAGPEPFVGVSSKVRFDRPTLFLPPGYFSEGVFTFSVFVQRVCRESMGYTQTTLSEEISKEIEVSVNSRPVGGFILVEEVNDPVIGDMTLRTNGWTDPDGDSPLTFRFEYAFIDLDGENEFEVSGTETFPFGDFSLGTSLTIFLPAALGSDQGKSLVIFAVARDALGATSRRTEKNSVVIRVGSQSNLSKRFNDAVREKLHLGETDQMAVIIFGAGSVETADPVSILNQAVNLITLAENVFREEGNFNFTAFGLCAQGLQHVAGILTQLTAEHLLRADSIQLYRVLKTRFDDLVTEFGLQLSRRRQERQSDDVSDKLAGSDVFNSVFVSLESFLSNLAQLDLTLVAASEAEVEASGEPVVIRYLQESKVDACGFLNSAKERLIGLDIVQTIDLPQGSGEITRLSGSISVTSIKDRFDALGSSVEQMSRFTFQKMFHTVVTEEKSEISPFETLSVIAIEWDDLDFRSSCQRLQEFLINPLKTSQNVTVETSVPNCLMEYNYQGPPTNTVRNILSLDFVQIENQRSVPLENLSTTQTIGINFSSAGFDAEDMYFNYDICRTENDICGIQLNYSSTRVCGAFWEANEDWLQAGCFVETQDEDSIQCRCNHATDYATWVAFRNDVAVFQIEQDFMDLSDTAKFIIFFFLPTVCLLFLFLFLWAKTKDKQDLRRTKYYAVGSLLIHKTIQQKKKAIFFQRYLDQREDMNATLVRVKPFIKKETLSKLTYFFAFFFALKNEHSLLGLSRFDPCYTRTERIAVFAGVVASSMFASALLFTLQCVESITNILFLVSVALAGAIIGSIFCKFFLRGIFASSAHVVGSEYDTVANSLKILNRVETVDGVQTETDTKLIQAYKNLLSAERTLSTSVKSSKLARKHSIPEIDPKYGGYFDKEECDDVQREPVSVAANRSTPTYDAEKEYSKALQIVRTCVLDSRDVWNSNSEVVLAYPVKFSDQAHPPAECLYTPAWEKTVAIQTQNNIFLQSLALFSSKSYTRAKPKRTLLGKNFVFLGWSIFIVLLAFSMFYTLTWITTRHFILDSADVLNANEVEVEYFREWMFAIAVGLVVSYLVAEPIVILLRYSLCPFLLDIFGNKNQAAFSAKENTWFKFNQRSINETKIHRSKSVAILEFFADLLEAI
eukprot:snap_masked-scaffold_49-processed-gene-0.11-mRNA-1 protein AED:1.00 eAED:1.00 QI:0/-1/0/0/-1/1/1/0/2154